MEQKKYKALDEVKELFVLARKEAKKRPDLAKRYVTLAREKLRKANMKVPQEYRRLFCRHCNSYFIYGRNVKVRMSRGKKAVTCAECGATRRYAYK